MAILSNHRDRRETIRRILARIVKMEDSARDDAFKKLIILAGLRKLKDTILTEVKHMPIFPSGYSTPRPSTNSSPINGCRFASPH
jgi:hypothetical protein